MALIDRRSITWFVITLFMLGIPIVISISNLSLAPEAKADSFTDEDNYVPKRLKRFTMSGSLMDTADCRVGVAVNQPLETAWVDDFGAGWYVSFGGFFASAGNGAEIMPIISVRQDKIGSQYLNTYTITPPLTESGLGALVDANPGTMWSVGNEPDRGPDPGSLVRTQDDTYPAIYAQAYHDVYYFIKDRDPTARMANAGLVGFTPNREQYLDLVWQAYWDRYHEPMPVDAWNMHLYILPEVNPQGQPNGIANVALGTDPSLAKSESYDPNNNPNKPPNARDTCPLDKVYCYAEHDDMSLFDDHVRRMRQWMKDHGQRDKPLILSEFSILYPYVDDGGTCYLQDEFGNCFKPSRVKNHLYNTVNYLETTAVDPQLGHPFDNNRMIQQWAWFSINQDPGLADVSNLVNDTLTAPTPLGVEFQNIVVARSQYMNLVAGPVSYPTGFSSPPSGTAEVTLKATIVNNGNKGVESEFQVTFYKDANLTQIIDTTTVELPGTGGPSVAGCVSRVVEAQIDWGGLTPGVHRYWVEIDSGDDVEEEPPSGNGDADNVASGFVIIDPDQLFLPIINASGS